MTSTVALHSDGIRYPTIDGGSGRRILDLKNVLFVQKNPHKAGAQHCLARVVRQLNERSLDPILLTSEDGWLTAECRKNRIRVIQLRFPGSRSVLGYLYKNKSFAKKVKAELAQLEVVPSIVQGNDHPEAIVTLELAKCLDARSSIILRAPSINRKGYFKYGCNRADLLITVSDQIKEAAHGWDQNREPLVIHDGLADEEFLPPKKLSAISPSKILVLGNVSARKGWRDVIEALAILWQQKDLPPITLDFTDQRPTWPTNPRIGERCSLNFIGHHDNFRELTRQYELVINPSRSESFGMAALEVVAAGVPLLSSRSGVIEEIIDDQRLLFEPGNPGNFAEALKTLLANWPAGEIDLESPQRKLRQRFHIKHSVDRLLDQYKKILG